MLLSTVLYIVSTFFIQLTTSLSFFSRHIVPTVAGDGDNTFPSHKQNKFPGYTDTFRRNYLSIPTFTRTGFGESDHASYWHPEDIPLFPHTEDGLTQKSKTSDPRGYLYHSHVDQRKDPLKANVGSQTDIGSINRRIDFDAMRLRNSRVNLLSNPLLKYKEFSKGIMKSLRTPSFFPRNIYQSRYRSNPSTLNTLNPFEFRMSLLAPPERSLFSSRLRFPKVNDDLGIPKWNTKDTYDSGVPTEDPFLSDLKEERSDRPLFNVHGKYARKLNSLLNVMNKEQETLATPSSVSTELTENMDILPNDADKDKSNSSSTNEDRIVDALDQYLDLSANRRHWTAGEVHTKRLEEDPFKIGTALDFSGTSRLSAQSSKSSHSQTEDGLIMNADLPSWMDPSSSNSMNRIKAANGGIIDDVNAENQKEKTQETFEPNKPSFLKVLNELRDANLGIYSSDRNIPEKGYFASSRQSDPFHTVPRTDTEPHFGFDKNKFDLSVTSFTPNTEIGNPQNLPSQGEGSFDSDTNDCEIIDTKTCSADSECSCLGLYFCIEGRCETISAPLQDKEGLNIGRMIWHEEPVTFDRK